MSCGDNVGRVGGRVRVAERLKLTGHVNVCLNLDVVEASLQANQALFDNTQDILSLIENNTDTINNILQNQTSINMTYNLDLLKDGDGTSVDRSTPNILRVNVTQQDYNISNNSLFNITSDFLTIFSI